MRHLVIVDGHHLLYRAYWAIPRSMKTSSGEQVNTAFGFASMLLQILRVEQPDQLLFCFDADEDTFRHKEYPEYKAGRSATPDDFHPQVPRVLQLLDAFHIKMVSGNAYEADDYACSYARLAERAGGRVTIVTGDRDLFQLSSETIRVAIPYKGYQMPEYMGPSEIFKKYGVTPAQIPAYKGLVGDASDNLPGVKGIGPKAAEALLQQYGSLESIYEHLGEIRASWRTKLEAGREQAFFCQRMALLLDTIPASIPLEDLAFQDIPTKSIEDFFSTLEFTLVAKRFRMFLETPYGRTHFLMDGTQYPSSAQLVSEGAPKKILETTQMTLL